MNPGGLSCKWYCILLHFNESWRDQVLFLIGSWWLKSIIRLPEGVNQNWVFRGGVSLYIAIMRIIFCDCNIWLRDESTPDHTSYPMYLRSWLYKFKSEIENRTVSYCEIRVNVVFGFRSRTSELERRRVLNGSQYNSELGLRNIGHRNSNFGPYNERLYNSALGLRN